MFFNMKTILEGYVGDSFFSAAKPLVESSLKNNPVLYNVAKATPLLYFGLKTGVNVFQGAKNSNEDWDALFFKEGGNLLTGVLLSRLLIDGVVQEMAGFNAHFGLKMGGYLLQLSLAMAYQYHANHAAKLTK